MHILYPKHFCYTFCSFGDERVYEDVRVRGFILLAGLTPCWEAGQEILQILWNSKVHYRDHRSPLCVPVRSQMNLVHAHPSYCLNIYFNTLLTSMHSSSKWLLSLKFSYWKAACSSLDPSQATWSSILSSLFDALNNICQVSQIMKIHTVQFSPPLFSPSCERPGFSPI
jgi:hypothetical protein